MAFVPVYCPGWNLSDGCQASITLYKFPNKLVFPFVHGFRTRPGDETTASWSNLVLRSARGARAPKPAGRASGALRG